jgi:hypothetical protein
MRDGPAHPRRPERSRSLSDRTIRIDPRPSGCESPRGEDQDDGLIDRFRRWFGARPCESRRAARHAARTDVVWLGWWRGEGNAEFFALTARLANISRGGALVVLRHPPPEPHPVWICLGTPEPDECLAASSLEVRRARRRECSVRLAFRSPCPSRFLEAAICGRASRRIVVSHPDV